MTKQTPNTTNTEADFRRSTQQAILDYIDKINQSEENIKSLAHLFRKINEEHKDLVTRATFYRYVNKLGITVKSGKCKVNNSPSKNSLYSLLTPKKYNKFLVYQLPEPQYGEIIAHKLNTKYSSKKNHIYFTITNDLLICFYYYNKASKNPYTQKKVKELIQNCLTDSISHTN